MNTILTTSKKLNTALGILSVSLALFCLYLVGTMIAENMLSEHLKKRLNQAGVKTEKALIKWSGRGLCAHEVHIRSPRYHFRAEIDQLCTRLSFKSTWPFLSTNDVLMVQPTIWLTFPRTSFLTASSEPNNKWVKLQNVVSKLNQNLRKIQEFWHPLKTKLNNIADHKVTIQGGLFHPNRELKAIINGPISFEAQVKAGDGYFQGFLPSLKQNISLDFTHNEVNLTSPLLLEFPQGRLKASANTKLSLLGHRRTLAGHFEWLPTFSIGSSFNVRLQQDVLANDSIKYLLQIKQKTKISKSLIISFEQRSKQIDTIKVQLEQIDFDFLALTKRLGIRFPFQNNSVNIQGRLDGTITLGNSFIKSSVLLQSPKLSLPSLPPLTWPKVTLNSFLQVPATLYDHFTPPLSHWKLKQLKLTIHDHLGRLLTTNIIADLSIRNSDKKVLEQANFELTTDTVSCQNLFNVIPQSLLGPINNVRLKGTVTPSLSIHFNRLSPPTSAPFAFKIDKLLKRCRFESMELNLYPKPKVTKRGQKLSLNGVEWLNQSFSFEINRSFTDGQKLLVGPETSSYVSLNTLPSYVGGAMYLTEETGFWRGGAFSQSLLNKAINTNLREGQFVYGGSTITQQLVKNLFLHRDKTLTRKIREALISARIVDGVSKRRVLELYLNMIEFGPKIFGIQAASQYYFQKAAKLLSPEEAIFLAMLKVSPHRGARWVKRGYSPKFTWWKNRTKHIFERLVKEGLISRQRALKAAPFILRWKNGQYQGHSPL